MSGVFKAVGKVFKKVGKVVKKVAPYALAAAAVAFTAGSALGITPGFGSAVSGVVGKLGLGSGASSVLSGAITKAGMGGALGGVLGGKKGLIGGTVAGAVAGGLSGALGGSGSVATKAAQGAGGSGGGGSPGFFNEFSRGLLPGGSGSAASAAAAPVLNGGFGGGLSAAAGAGQLASTAAGAASRGGLLGFINQNPMIASQVLQSVGGVLAGDPAKAAYKSESKLLTQRADQERAVREEAAANYRMRSGLLGDYANPNNRLDPTDRFNPTYYQPGQSGAGPAVWVYDEKLGRVVQRPAGAI